MTRAVKHAIIADEVADLGWVGKYVVPGRAVTTVTDRRGQPECFSTRAEALAVAGMCLCAVLNGARERQVFVPRSKPVGETAVSLSAEARRVFSNFS